MSPNPGMGKSVLLPRDLVPRAKTQRVLGLQCKPPTGGGELQCTKQHQLFNYDYRRHSAKKKQPMQSFRTRTWDQIVQFHVLVLSVA